MVQLRTYQSNFTGGELSPAMQSRTDVSKYQAGVKLASNFLLKPQGGLRFRNGFAQVGEIFDTSFRITLIPFNVAEQEAYVLAFGDQRLNFIRDGAYVLDSNREVEITSVTTAAPAVVTAPGNELEEGEQVFLYDMDGAPDITGNFYRVTNLDDDTFELFDRWGEPVDRASMGAATGGMLAPLYSIPTPYRSWQARTVQFAQDQATMFLFSRNHPVHRLTRTEVDEWELVEETFRPSIEPPSGLRVTSSLLDIPPGDEIPGSYELSRSGRITRTDSGGLPVPVQNGDLITLTGSGGGWLLGDTPIGETFEAANVDISEGQFDLVDYPGSDYPTSISWEWEGQSDYEPGSVAPGVYELSGGNPAVASRVDGEPIGVPLSNGTLIFMARVDSNGYDTLAQIFEVSNVDSSAGTFEIEGLDRENEDATRFRWARAAPYTGAGGEDDDPQPIAYRIGGISEETGEESLGAEFAAQTMNDLTIAGNTNTLSWPRQPGITLYIVYKEENGIFGFIGNTEQTRFVDENVVPDLSDTPQRLRNPFEGAGNWPKTGTFFEQRLWLANTENNPSGVWASQTTESRNFNISRPARDDDAITFAVRGQRITNVEALLPTENLIMMTAGGEWIVRGSQVDEVLTPSNLILRQRAFRGSTDVQPLLIGDTVLHVQRGGNAVRDFRMGREIESTEISLLARHLVQDHEIVDWAYSQSPDSVVWVVREDGVLLSLTYMLEHEIWGWTRHEIGGADAVAESVACIPEGGVDAVYVTVRRTINGQNKRYVQRLVMQEPPDARDVFHVDAGLRYAGERTDILYGFDHLEGESLVGVLDGNVVRDLVVENGRIELPIECERAAVGLPYAGRVETLDLDLGPMQDAGSVLARYKSITEVAIRVVDTRGLFVGQARGGQMYEHRQRAAEDWNDPIALFTGDIVITPEPDWSTGGTLILEQRDPLPALITGAITEWEFGE